MIEVRNAVIEDLLYIDYLQKKNAEDLAFYPSVVFEREILNARILLALVNGEPAGYMYHGSVSSRKIKIHQACIQYDLRGYMYGSELVKWLINLGKSAHAHEINLRCGSDIAANGFWRTMGFQCQSVTQGGARRMRDINAWTLEIEQPLFPFVVDPSNKQKSAQAWSKARQDGISLGSQFKRGKDMQEYRKIVEKNTKQAGGTA
jgi:hypothetical protein